MASLIIWQFDNQGIKDASKSIDGYENMSMQQLNIVFCIPTIHMNWSISVS